MMSESEVIHEYRQSPTSSDSEGEKASVSSSSHSWKKRLFGKKKSVHAVLGGGKSADIILWRNKQMSGGIFSGVTVVWLLFEWMGYHFLTFFCHAIIFSLLFFFLWTNAASFVKRDPPKFPDVVLPEDLFLTVAQLLRCKINEAFAAFRCIASGKDLKKFLMAIGGLWVLSVIGNWFSFLTLFYIVFVVLYALPVFYEKYEDQVDAAAAKAMVEIKKQYAVLEVKVLCKIPGCPLGNKKQH